MNNKKIYIGFFIPSMRGGGAEKIFINLVNEFSKRNLKVDLVLAQKEGPYLKDISKDVNIVDLKSSRILKSMLPLMKYLKSEKPDVLLSTLTHANIASIVAKIISRSKVKLIIRQAIHYRLPSNKIKTFLEKSLFKKQTMLLLYQKGLKLF